MTWLVHLGGSQRAARTGRHSPQLLITDSWAITRLFSVVASPSSTCHIPRRSAAFPKIPCSYFEAIHRHGLAYGDTPPELSVVTRRPAFSLSPRCLAASIAAAGGPRRRAWSTRPLGPLRSSADPILQSIPDRLDPLNSTNRLPARLVVPQQPHRPRRPQIPHTTYSTYSCRSSRCSNFGSRS